MAKNKANELYITRLYDAPLKLVWEAWTDPEQVALWWGPRGFTLTTHSKDLRPGGHWAYTMHGPDGTDYPNHTIYHEVEKYKRLVYDHGGYQDRPPLFRVTVTFQEEKGKTRMEMTMALPSPEAAAETKKFIRQAGGNATWDRLAEYLAAQEGVDRFVINRSFAAPVSTVFTMWTDPAHLSRWLAPVGFSMKILKGEIQEGSGLFYEMSDGEGTSLYGRIDYRKISPPDALVYTQVFCDEQGALARHPHLSVWPETMLTTVSFVAEEGGSTRVTVTWEVFGEASGAERAAFRELRPSMTQGWTGSFDKLEGLLEKGRQIT
jgi:uncharacterized protein YndB with AHSA1/START domain